MSVLWDDALVSRPLVLEQLWREQSAWSRTADAMKARIDRARLTALVIVVVVAATATTATAVSDTAPWLGRALAALAALGSALLPTMRPAWSGKQLRDWTRARSVAEALKADIHLWLAEAGPFVGDASATELLARANKLKLDAADLLPRLVEPLMRNLPAVHDLPSFFAVRVEGQFRDYYDRKVGEIRRRIVVFRWIEIGLGVAGAVLGVVAAVIGASFAAWIAVLATIGTALSAHVSATRYEFQLIEFSRTSEELRQIYAAAALGIGADELRRLATRAERVISVENQGWMAKLAEDPPVHQAPGPPPAKPD